MLFADAHRAKALDPLAGSDLEELTHLYLSVLHRWIGKALGPFQRLILGLHLNQCVAGYEILGLREGPIDDGASLPSA